MIRKFGSIAGLEMQPSGLDVGLGGGSVSKSIQRGSTLLLTGATTTINITITSVDMSKSIVIVSTIPKAGSTQNAEIYVRGILTSSTNLQLVRNTGSGATDVSWVVVEFNNVKSLQTGSKSISVASATVTVSAVNTSKSLLFASWTTADTTNSFEGLTNYVLTDSTTLTFTQNGFYSKSIQWYLVEFN